MDTLPKWPIAVRGFMGWEFQWGRVCVFTRTPRWWRYAGVISIRLTDKDGNL